MARFKETELICFHDSQLIYVYMFRYKKSVLVCRLELPSMSEMCKKLRSDLS